MGRGPQQTFFQRRHTDGQQVHEKMLKITNHQRNANQNHNEISPYTWLSSKRQEITSIGEDVEKREPMCTVGGNINWYSNCRKQYGGSTKN